MNQPEVNSGCFNEAIKPEVMKRWSDHGVEPEVNSPTSYLNPDAAEFTPAMGTFEKERVLLIGDLYSKKKEDNTNTSVTDQVTLPCR